MGKTKDSYYNEGSISCAADCTISNNGGCNYCGDGVKNGSEACDGTTSVSTLCQGVTKTYYSNNPTTKTLSFGYVNDSTISIETASITQNSSNYNANGWNLQSGNQRSGSYALCARNYGDDSSTNEITFSIKPPASGKICFWWKGESEANYDKFTYKFNGSTIFNEYSGSTSYRTYQQRCETVTAGSTYTFYFKYAKDGSAEDGIDRYCIDDITIPVNQTLSSDPSNMTCTSNCQKTGACYNYCGDNSINGYEVCDDGSSNNDNYGNHCNASCTGKAPYCGDGIRQSNETCDYGETTNCSNVGDYNQGTASCNSSCTWDISSCSKSSGGGGC